MYISLFHGRENPNQDMSSWGTYGPIIGPVYFAMTYGVLKVISHENELEFFNVTNNLIFLDGVYYGDMEIIDDNDPILWAPINIERKISFSEFKKLNQIQ